MQMTKKEYKQMCLTGSTEPERRKSQVIYDTARPRDLGVTGYHTTRITSDKRNSKPKIRIAIIPKHGNPRLKVVDVEQLNSHHIAAGIKRS